MTNMLKNFNQETERLFDEKYPLGVFDVEPEDRISLKSFISQRNLALLEEIEREILKKTEWVDPKEPEGEERDWKIHYDGYREVRKDILSSLKEFIQEAKKQ